MVISRPCIHPDCPPRDGFIRGQYESVEFVREIYRKPEKASSTTDLSRTLQPRGTPPSSEKETLLRSVELQFKDSKDEFLDKDGQLTPAAANEVAKEGRKRGKTISFAGSRGASAKGEAMDDPEAHDDAETNPVEWTMITRSDPGGSVPRFMVERGTPGGIVADASKFLDWACKKEHPQDEVDALEKGDVKHIQKKIRQELEAYETNGHLAGLDGEADGAEAPRLEVSRPASMEAARRAEGPAQQAGLLAAVTNAAYAGLESYAPQIVIDHLPSHQHAQPVPSIDEVTAVPNGTSATLSRSISSASSIVSFASAEDHFDDTLSTRSNASQSRSTNNEKDTAAMSPHARELAKLNERKRKLNESLAKAREKELKDKEELTSKEEERLRRAEERHAKEVAKQEEKYKKEVAKLEAKRQKEAAKAEERKRKEEDKDEKRRLNREKDELRQELEVVGRERDILREQVRALQKENNGLVLRLGKTDEGKDVVKEVKREVEEGGTRRSRSGSGNG